MKWSKVGWVKQTEEEHKLKIEDLFVKDREKNRYYCKKHDISVFPFYRDFDPSYWSIWDDFLGCDGERYYMSICYYEEQNRYGREYEVISIDLKTKKIKRWPLFESCTYSGFSFVHYPPHMKKTEILAKFGDLQPDPECKSCLYNSMMVEQLMRFPDDKEKYEFLSTDEFPGAWGDSLTWYMDDQGQIFSWLRNAILVDKKQVDTTYSWCGIMNSVQQKEPDTGKKEYTKLKKWFGDRKDYKEEEKEIKHTIKNQDDMEKWKLDVLAKEKQVKNLKRILDEHEQKYLACKQELAELRNVANLSHDKKDVREHVTVKQ